MDPVIWSVTVIVFQLGRTYRDRRDLVEAPVAADVEIHAVLDNSAVLISLLDKVKVPLGDLIQLGETKFLFEPACP